MIPVGRSALWRGLLAVLLVPLPLSAQRQEHTESFGAAGRVVHDVEIVLPAVRQCSWGWARVETRNETERVRRVDLELRSYWTSQVSSSLSFEVEPDGSEERFLPIPMVGADLYLQVVTAGGQGDFRTGIDNAVARSPEWSMLLVGADLEPNHWTAASARLFGSSVNRVRSIEADHLPPQWWLLSGADLVVVQGADPDLDAAAQSTLDDALRGGGSLLVLEADRLGEGALRDRFAAADGDGVLEARVGMGRLLALDRARSRDLPGGVWTGVAGGPITRFEPRGFLGSTGSEERFAGPLASGAFAALELPGLGDVPLRLFFMILLGFAVVVGPWNYLHHKRRRRLPMLLVTVPVLGFGVTGLILAYGLLSEGLGAKETARSVAVLDQVRHEATCWSHRSVYASLGPGEIRPARGTALGPVPVLQSNLGHSVIRRSDGSFSGALVPSRTISVVPTATVRTERARLRFRRGAEGGYEVLADAAIQPLDIVGSVLVRDSAGRFHGNVQVPGRVEPISVGTAQELARTALGSLGLPVDVVLSGHGTPPPVSPAESFAAQIGLGSPGAEQISDLPANSYLVRVARPVGADDLGIEARQLRGAHLLFGTLGEEDFVD